MTQPAASKDCRKILILADSGLADFVLGLDAFAALRTYHSDHRVTVWTQADVIPFARVCPYVDDTQVIPPVPWRLHTEAKVLKSHMAESRYERVYDLFPTSNTARLFALMKPLLPFQTPEPGPEWCGPYDGAAFPTEGIDNRLPLKEWLEACIAVAGVPKASYSDMSWVGSQIQSFSLPVSLDRRLILIVVDPGAPFWGSEQIAAFSARAIELERTPVLVSLNGLSELALEVKSRIPAAVDLTAHENILDLMALAWAAEGAVGPDAGLMHLIARLGCRSVLLFGPGSDPAIRRPKQRTATVLQRHDVAAITIDEVFRHLGVRGEAHNPPRPTRSRSPF